MYDVRNRAKAHRHPLDLAAVYLHLCNITCVFHHIPHTHCPLYKGDLWKHGLVLLIAGHWSVLHSSEASYVLYWNNAGTESAWGNWGTWGNAQPKAQWALPFSMLGGESAGKAKGGFDTQLASTGITCKWRQRNVRVHCRAEQQPVLREEGNALTSEWKPAREENQRETEKRVESWLGYQRGIQGRSQRGMGSLRSWETPQYKLTSDEGERRAEWEKGEHVLSARRELADRKMRKRGRDCLRIGKNIGLEEEGTIKEGKNRQQ